MISILKNSQVQIQFSHKLYVTLLCTPFLLSTPAIAASTAYVERFEAVAQDAATYYNAPMANDWGLHQPRITRHGDGTIRLLYLTPGSENQLAWNLMRRDSSGNWSKEASGPSEDDVSLMRDARYDKAYVVAWPYSIPVVYSSPTFTVSAIPGSWQLLSSPGRHYGNAGIGSDGTLCVKASHELDAIPVTSSSNTEYACGLADSKGQWYWPQYVTHLIGLRHAYDYIFPNPEGLGQGMYATSTRDLYKTASDIPNLDPIYGNYVFNGIRYYATSTTSDANWRYRDSKIQVSNTLRVAPTMRLHESFIDSKGRIFSGYFADNPTDSSVRGLYVNVNDNLGNQLYQSKWTTLPPYGYTRIFEDGKNRLWLLWTSQGSQATQVRLYPIIETTEGNLSAFTLGDFTDLKAAFYPYSIQGGMYITAPRGGNARSPYVDAIVNTCWTTYQKGVDFNNSSCYGSNNSAPQRVFYTRIRLPD